MWGYWQLNVQRGKNYLKEWVGEGNSSIVLVWPAVFS
jgi:hypothetical protein